MTNQTRNAIDDLLAVSFKELASKKSIDKITIKEITDKAGVIRPTFYNHFQDKYELLEWIVKKELIEPMLPYLMEAKVKEGVAVSLNAISENKEFYHRAVKLEGQNSFAEVLTQTVSELLLQYIDEKVIASKLPYTWITPEKTADFLSGMLCYAVIRWVENGMDIPVDELVDTFIYMSYHSFIEMLLPE